MDTCDCQGPCVTFAYEIQVSEPLGASRKLSLLLCYVERPGQWTEPLGAVLHSCWEADSHSTLSVPYCVLEYSLPGLFYLCLLLSDLTDADTTAVP